MQNTFKRSHGSIGSNGNKNIGDVQPSSYHQKLHEQSTSYSSQSPVFNGRPQTFDIFVGRIPMDWSEEKLREIFSPFGDIRSVNIKESPDFKYNTKIAFVRFSREEDAKQSIEFFSRNPVGDISLQVNMAQRLKYKERLPGQQGNEQSHWSSHKSDNRGHGRASEVEYGGGYSHNAYYNQYGRDSGHSYHMRNGQQRRDGKHNGSVQRRVVPRQEFVLVTEVQSAVSFWGQVGIQSVAHSLAKSSEELQVYCPTGLKLSLPVQKNKIYGGLYPLDNMWYRCTVLECGQQGMVKVKYVDYGNVETIDQNYLVELPPLLSDAPPFAHLYQLADCTVCSDSAMTNPLALEQLRNLINSKLVTLKVVSETSRGICEVIVEHPDEPGKTIDDVMIAGGCIQRIKRNNGGGMIERSVAGKLRVQNENQESEQSKNNKILKHENGNLRKSIKFQCETICNLNKLNDEFKQQKDTLEQQNNELKRELHKSFNQKVVLSTMKDLKQTRSNCVLDGKKSKVIEDKIPLVNDVTKRLTLENIDTFSKACHSLGALKLVQDSIRNCKDKEKLKELVKERDEMKKELYSQVNLFLEEISSIFIDEREENLKTALKDLDVFHQSSEENEPSFEQAIANYEDWKANQYKQLNSVRTASDIALKTLAGEFEKLQKFLDLSVSFDLDDCDSVNLDSAAMDFIQAVTNEMQETPVPEDVKSISSLIAAMKKRIQLELSDINRLRTTAVEYKKLQENLGNCLENEPDVSKILNVRKNLRSVKSQFRHKQADQKVFEEGDDVNNEDLKKVEGELVELREQLHDLMEQEQSALDELAQLADELFPELPLLYSEFSLKKYMATNGLVKQGWELTFYAQNQITKSLWSNCFAFQTSFNGNPCVLKDFDLKDIANVDSFEERAVMYSKVKHSNLMELQALFYDKINRKAFLQLPCYETNLKMWLGSSPSDESKRVVFHDTVESLHCLHKAGITHGAVVMENIFVDKNTRGILGEYSFVNDTQKRVSSTAEVLLKSTVPIPCEASPVFDMYCLGEVACQVFLDQIPMVRDLTCLEKLSQNEDVTSMLSFLLALDGGFCPTSSQVLGHPFFSHTEPSVKGETIDNCDVGGQFVQEEKTTGENGQEGDGEGEGEAEREVEEKEGEKEDETQVQVNGQKEKESNEDERSTSDGIEEKEEKQEERNETVMEERPPVVEKNGTPDEKPVAAEEEHDEKPIHIVDKERSNVTEDVQKQPSTEVLSHNGSE